MNRRLGRCCWDCALVLFDRGSNWTLHQNSVAVTTTPKLFRMTANGIAEWGVVTAIALPHFLYALIWFFPDAWRRLCGKHPVAHFQTAAWMLKGAIDHR